jgi:hypothetical protein
VYQEVKYMNTKLNREPLSVKSILTTLNHWAFADLTVVTFGGLLIVALLSPFFGTNGAPMGFTIAGAISGLFVGFLPYFEEMIKSSELSRWLPLIKAVAALMTVGLLGITLLNALLDRSILLLFLWVLPGIAISMLMTWITRPVCDDMLKLNARWWQWIAVAAGDIVVIVLVGGLVVFITSR